MTANATVEDREACRAAGMDDFLSKPIRPADLIRVLRGSKVAVRATPEPESPLDLSVFASLREIVDGVPGALRDMVRQYITTGEELIKAVSDALVRRDCGAARLAAHSLKGASAQMGARHVAAAALRIEKASAAEDADAARVFLPVLRTAQQAAVPLLRAACDEAQPSSKRPLVT
jgi:HPt (histidine-containing phosphotransfer) domain-containing protein